MNALAAVSFMHQGVPQSISPQRNALTRKLKQVPGFDSMHLNMRQAQQKHQPNLFSSIDSKEALIAHNQRFRLNHILASDPTNVAHSIAVQHSQNVANSQ